MSPVGPADDRGSDMAALPPRMRSTHDPTVARPALVCASADGPAGMTLPAAGPHIVPWRGMRAQARRTRWWSRRGYATVAP